MSACASRLLALSWGLILFLSPIIAANAAPTPQRLSACPGDCVYLFAQLSLPTDQYSERLIPLFDESATFDDLIADLVAHRIFYALDHECVPLSAFPSEVQTKLESFKPGDNLVADFRGTTTIHKIKSRHPSLVGCEAALPREPSRAVDTKTAAPPRAPANRKPTPLR
jgi:hypothetical protein